MSKNITVHVVPRNEGWVVRKGGVIRVSSVHKTQRDAIEAARELAKSQSAELMIHGRDGRIRSRDSYGDKPLAPQDRVVLFPLQAASVSGATIREAVKAVNKSSKKYSQNAYPQTPNSKRT